MENGKEEMMSREPVSQPANTAGDTIRQSLDEAMFKLLNFQAQHGADQNTTMIMLALMNLLGIVNCMNRILPEGQRVRGTDNLAAQISGMLGGAAPPPGFFQGPQGPPGGPGGIDPAMLAALAGMLGGPRGPEGPGEPGNRPGLDPALLGALASMLGGPGGGGANPAALMAMLANMMGPRRPPEGQRPKESQAKEEKRINRKKSPNKAMKP
ncbi:hypothetical protein P378_07980 [Desulforamulus profundi]|uniref:Uncharacterized protein n=1 Tax=Desulforamulus profundi TaxID=1383067 RepID=A0A2C6MGX1_9FIRM|nr:hypothetical protein [Desulforamulus profundi]PHJ38723.1 hypothetical protein P378_07980 [Desulforamulus profundi]